MVVKLIIVVVDPVHITWLDGWLTCGSGRTITVYVADAVCGAQLLLLVTVMVSVTVFPESVAPAV